MIISKKQKGKLKGKAKDIEIEFIGVVDAIIETFGIKCFENMLNKSKRLMDYEITLRKLEMPEEIQEQIYQFLKNL